MKVCTDACVLGATANLSDATRLLDIGTGTGLLALMAAQRNPDIRIEAVELDEAAAAQALDNVSASPWAERIRVHRMSLAQFARTQPEPFDHLICNPPFFRHSLRSPDAARTTARHTAADTLSFEELIAFTTRYLGPDGQLTVLLPPPEMHHFEQMAALGGFFPSIRLQLHHRLGSRVSRHITTFTRMPNAPESSSLAIYAEAESAYSPEFKALLRDFYLAF
ncbi:methyltransferase small [Hymenobacter roseosalivarius DSM 11622]|uniref:tRNA1(Val) (adenine(37)-N6)-methyltransferase n=2 Tax=Hymenobacter roseosalivarius TaxID=89967 RepID=A0A1W1W3T6_9BACT|nr:methyltransferase small [Hymenobacter roseosalivarius DSM 11622]